MRPVNPRRPGVTAAAPAGRIGHIVTERDSERIVRQWNREIEDEARRAEARERANNGPWKAVTWTALWVVWLGLLVALFVPIAAHR